MKKVSVIITAHNYGKYLSQAIDSVLDQQYNNYEIIVVNDGSTDNTADILRDYVSEYKDRIKIITTNGLGLAKAANCGIRSSCGEYIVRLDADDYFDENILLIESNILDRHDDIHMVYPDYYRINQDGDIIDSYRLLKVNEEVKLLDRSPLAAGAMYRRECYEAIGGYNEELRYQEDYDFWIRFTDKYNVYNVNLPLMYYRKHDASMSTNFEARMQARQYVKKKFVEEKGLRCDKKIVAVIPAMGLFRNKEKLALKSLGNKPLIAYIIEEALKSELIDRLIVSTEDKEIAEVAIKYGAEVPFLRPLELAKTSVPMEDVLKNMLDFFSNSDKFVPEIFIVLSYNTPFCTNLHIDESIDSLLLYDTDSVLSVNLDLSYHWKPSLYGLEPVIYQKRLLREDKDSIYKENGAIYVVKSKNILEHNYLGSRIGHIEMSFMDGWKIEDNLSLFIAEQILKVKNDKIL